jgi:putative NADH-flavin reductase
VGGDERGMKLVVLGATGGVGLEVVGQAIERGHAVTALVRSPEPLGKFGDRVAVRRGDLLKASDLAEAVEGCDVVLSAFGPRLPLAKIDHDLLERFARCLVSAMSDAKVPRLILVSTAFLFKDAILPPSYLVGRLFFPSVVRDAGRMEEIVAKTELSWTVARPPRLTDRARTERYRVREGHLPRMGFTISRASVAHFLLQEAEKKEHVRALVGVAN